MSELFQNKETVLIGVISDTHGLLRPEVIKAFKGVDMIVHAGDIDKPEVLEALNDIAPVAAVRGNMDRGVWTKDLPSTLVVNAGSAALYVLHSAYGLDLDPGASGFSAVISGHTHQPFIQEKNGVLFLNPGSAGHRRYDYPVSVALLRVSGKSLDPRIIKLQ